MIISVNNSEIIDNVPVTYLTAPISSGIGTLPVKALNQFNASWATQVGNTGEAQSEILLLGTATPSGTIGTTTANTLYPHPTDTPVFAIKYNQIVFERSTTGTGGIAAPIAGGTVTIQPNGTVTIFDDTTGSTTYAYKTYFRNSVLNVTSPESGWITTSGYPLYSLASIRQRVRDKLYNSNFIADDAVIDNWTNEWLEMMNNAAVEVNQDFLIGSTSLTFGAGTDTATITNTDFKQVARVWMTADGVNQYEAGKVSLNEIDPNYIYDGITPVFAMYGDNQMVRKPSSAGGTANVLYYKMSPTLVNDTDTLPVSMQGYSKSFVDYDVAQALRKDNRFNEATGVEQSAQSQLVRFKADITPRSQTGPSAIRMDEPAGAEDMSWY